MVLSTIIMEVTAVLLALLATLCCHHNNTRLRLAVFSLYDTLLIIFSYSCAFLELPCRSVFPRNLYIAGPHYACYMFLILVSDWVFHFPLVECLKVDHYWLCLISLLSNCTHPICSHSFRWGVYDIHDILRSWSALLFFLLDVILKCDYCCCFFWVWQQFKWNWLVFEYSSSRWFWFCV